MPDDGSGKIIVDAQQLCALAVGHPDERGNTIKYIYARDPDYVVYYGRLEHEAGDQDSNNRRKGQGRFQLGRLGRLARLPVSDPAYESEGVQVQIASAKRAALRRKLLPLGTERAMLQALLNGWPRRQSYDTSIATALQQALDGDGDDKSVANALETLRTARGKIGREREMAGRAQYVKYLAAFGIIGVVLLVFAQHNLFRGSGGFWWGTQAGLLGAVLSISLSLRGRTVAIDIGRAGNMSDCVLRLIIGAISGGTLVLLLSSGLIPPFHVLTGDLDPNKVQTALLLGTIAGFVEKLVPSLLEERAGSIGNRGAGTPQRGAANDGNEG